MSTRSMSAARLLVSLFCIGMLSACASSIVVTGSVPTPLIKKLPLSAELSYSDEFKRYNYQEKEKGRPLKNLEFGQAQLSMFDRVFRGILTVVDTASTNGNGQAIDLRIAPELLDFQYSVPRETSMNLYEVWLKYRVQITDPVDTTVADWVVKGYGKTPTATLSSAATAFNAATNIALRDVGAQLAIGFARQDAIARLLKTKAAGALSTKAAGTLKTKATGVKTKATGAEAMATDAEAMATDAEAMATDAEAMASDAAAAGAEATNASVTDDVIDSLPMAEEQEVN